MQKIKNLIQIYYNMDYGLFIDNHLELIQPDENYNIYISRKALKHFVESRKKEMFGTHTESEILNKLYFAVDNIVPAYDFYDKFEIETVAIKPKIIFLIIFIFPDTYVFWLWDLISRQTSVCLKTSV